MKPYILSGNIDHGYAVLDRATRRHVGDVDRPWAPGVWRAWDLVRALGDYSTRAEAAEAVWQAAIAKEKP